MLVARGGENRKVLVKGRNFQLQTEKVSSFGCTRTLPLATIQSLSFRSSSASHGITEDRVTGLRAAEHFSTCPKGRVWGRRKLDRKALSLFRI